MAVSERVGARTPADEYRRRVAGYSLGYDTAPSGPGGQLSLEEVDRLQRQLNQVSLGRREEAGSGHSVEAGRPLASMQKIMAGTFSSDDSETARNRMAEATRGIPGSLMGPLALSKWPLVLYGDPGSTSGAMGVPPGMPPAQQAMGSSAMPSFQQTMGSLAMPTFQQTMGSSAMPSLQQTMGSSAMPSLQQTMGSSAMPSLQQTMGSSAMPSLQQAMGSQNMSSSQSATGVQQSEQPSETMIQQMMQAQQVVEQGGGDELPQGAESWGPYGPFKAESSGLSGGGEQDPGFGFYRGPGQPRMDSTLVVAPQGHRRTEAMTSPTGVQPPSQNAAASMRITATSDAVDEKEGGGAHGSPVSVAALHPPVEAGIGMRSDGLVMGAPQIGMVMVDGVWREYYMIRGQMVVQPMRGGGQASTLNLTGNGGVAAAGSSQYPPPPPPNPPVTPKAAAVSAGVNMTPGGTPVPPPPPTTPMTTTSTSSGGVFGEEVEEPSKLVIKLPSLPTAKGGDAAVVAGDWLAQLEPSMSSLSTTAVTWWTSLMNRVKELYSLWLESAPVARLSNRQQVLARRPPQDRHHRVEQRAAMLLLDALPDELRHEAVSARAVTAESMVFMVHCAYQPGGAGEKAHLLRFLTAPETGTTLESTLNLARKWIRLFRRGRELAVVLPDPSLLCRGLDKLVSATFLGNKHPSATFRIASFKLERQLDYRATAVDIEDYAHLILGELEAAQLAQPVPAQPPKLNRLEEAKGAEVEKGKGKSKSKQQRPCWSWQDGSGCKYGNACMFQHASLGPGRCWECGSDSHLKPQCPILGQGGNASGGAAQNQSSNAASGKGGGGSSATTSAATSGSSVPAAEEKPRKPPRKKGGGKAKEAVRKAEESVQAEGGAGTTTSTTIPTPSTMAPSSDNAREEFFEEAAKALKSLRLARATLDRVCALDGDGARALVDSGATTSMRSAKIRSWRAFQSARFCLQKERRRFTSFQEGPC